MTLHVTCSAAVPRDARKAIKIERAPASQPLRQDRCTPLIYHVHVLQIVGAGAWLQGTDADRCTAVHAANPVVAGPPQTRDCVCLPYQVELPSSFSNSISWRPPTSLATPSFGPLAPNVRHHLNYLVATPILEREVIAVRGLELYDKD